ncbi:MAG: hypothetical protein IKV32_00125 [Muribaculaceae bacterium]|nr:hypothetical protein [Muribaculaceae bacterium]
MRKLAINIFIMCVAMVCNAQSQCDSVDVARVKASVEVLMRDYPQATLQDVYKSCFQDYFGVAHLLGSREQVYNYICKELEADDYVAGSRYYEKCGWNVNHYRVYLNAIKEGYITADILADAFMASAPEEAPQVTEQWVNQWQVIEKIVRECYPDLYNLDVDSNAISEMLSQGKYVMHHSRRFNAAYHPHYRIIRRDIFEREILPKLPQ